MGRFFHLPRRNSSVGRRCGVLQDAGCQEVSELDSLVLVVHAQGLGERQDVLHVHVCKACEFSLLPQFEAKRPHGVGFLQRWVGQWLTFLTTQNYSFYAAIAVAVLEIVSLLLFGHKLRNVKKQGGGYTKITVQQMG